MGTRLLLVGITAAASVSAAAAAVASARPADGYEWKVGLARVKITPQEPIRLRGYASRTQLSRGVVLDLYAKAAVLEDAAGHRAALVTCDLIGVSKSFSDELCRHISAATGLERQQILLNFSHTHTGPAVAADPAELDFPPEQAEVTIRYSRDLQQKLTDLVAEAMKRLEPARLAWSVGVAEFVMNRRQFTDRGVRLGVNPRGLADRSVPVLGVASPAGKLLAVIFGTACHNTTLTGRHLEISGDYAGYAQAEIERQRPGVQAMFVQGCGGDANPYPRGSEELARQHGQRLGREVLRVLGDKLRPVSGPLRTEYAPVELPLQPAPAADEMERMARSGGWRRFVAKRMQAVIEKQGKLPACYATGIALWQFGSDLTLVGLPGEVVVDYVPLLEKAVGPTRLWVAGYCNDIFGYLPSARVLAEGGYETRGLYSGGVGFFAPAVEQVVVSQVRRLAAEAGRPGLD